MIVNLSPYPQEHPLLHNVRTVHGGHNHFQAGAGGFVWRSFLRGLNKLLRIYREALDPFAPRLLPTAVPANGVTSLTWPYVN